jgi:hypothetical protein
MQKNLCKILHKKNTAPNLVMYTKLHKFTQCVIIHLGQDFIRI